MIMIFGGQRKQTLKSRFQVKIKCAVRCRCFTAQCGHIVVQTAKYNNVTKSDFSFFFRLFVQVRLEWPTDLAINPMDNSIYVLDNNVVLQITENRQV